MMKKYVLFAICFIVLCLIISPFYGQETPIPEDVTPAPTAEEEPLFPECADVNQDGKISIIDALLIAQCYVGLPLCSCDFGPCPDVDCNNNINIIDALLIAQYYVGLPIVLCC